jgi:hypothetical protein
VLPADAAAATGLRRLTHQQQRHALGVQRADQITEILLSLLGASHDNHIVPLVGNHIAGSGVRIQPLNIDTPLAQNGIDNVQQRRLAGQQDMCHRMSLQS